MRRKLHTKRLTLGPWNAAVATQRVALRGGHSTPATSMSGRATAIQPLVTPKPAPSTHARVLGRDAILNASPEPTSDVERAHDVQRALRALGRHCPHYARALGGRSGVRLAGHLVTGEVAFVTAKGLEALLTAHALLTRACSIDPGLDTNTFMDKLLVRTDPHAKTSGRTQ